MVFKSHVFVFIGLLLVLFACERSTESPAGGSGDHHAFTDTYQPPHFQDSARIEKIRSTKAVVDQIFKAHFENNHFPGMAYGLVVDGQLIYSNAFGLANTETRTAATTQTDFRIASMSKSFTAMAILKLRDEGKLSLSDPVAKYIPAFARVRYLTSDAPPITIEHLLTMSAGFPEDNPWGDRQLADTDDELVQLISDGISFSNAPGLHFEYSNLGFATLGRVVGIVSGQSYQHYITESILKPLQMNDARWEYSEVPKEKLALGYRWEDEQWKEEPMLHDGSYGAMGGLICSVDDFSKYVAFHLAAWPPRNEEESPIIKRSSLREMHQLQVLGGLFPDNRTRSGERCAALSGYGYGLGYRQDCKGIVSIRHGGGLPGFGSEWRFYPEYGIGIVSLSNLTYGGLGSSNAKALDTLIHLANLQPMTLPVSAILSQRQKEITEVITSWPQDKLTVFAENFFMDQSLESWKKSSSGLWAEAGKIEKVNPVQPENQLRGTFIIECEKQNVAVFFTLTPEKNPLIQQLDLTLIPKEEK